MIKANQGDKQLIVDILTKSFQSNQSVNYIAKQDSKRTERISSLMDYSFEVCHSFGDVFLSDDKKACALVLYPDKKKTTFKSILLDVKLEAPIKLTTSGRGKLTTCFAGEDSIVQVC